jgi:5,10-methylenetetrahydromethanopterin reductase
MRIGIQFDPRTDPDLKGVLAEFSKAEEEGFHDIWIGQVFGHDVLTLLALAGQCTSRIGLGVSVVPLPTRHPTVLAQQALTAQLATSNRLCLGVGCGHAKILDRKLGLEHDHPVGRTREALEVLLPLLRGEYVKYAGEYQQVRAGIEIQGAEPPPIILAALGPRMIELAAELTDGVSLVYVGVDFIRERVKPLLPEGRRIVASLPIAVTDDPDAVTPRIEEYTAPSTVLPAYQRVLEAQGIDRMSRIGYIGSRALVEDGLDALAEVGVTHLNPIVLPVPEDPGCARRTRELLADRALRSA